MKVKIDDFRNIEIVLASKTLGDGMAGYAKICLVELIPETKYKLEIKKVGSPLSFDFFDFLQSAIDKFNEVS
jgi:hypothetical protein